MARDMDSLAKEIRPVARAFLPPFERSTCMTPHVYLNLLRMELAV